MRLAAQATMWIQAILTKQDLEHVLQQLTPLKVALSDDGPARILYLGRPQLVELVAGEGLRIVCRARVRLGVAGIKLPIKLHSLRVMLRPYIRRDDGHEVLAFRLRVEEADVKSIPHFVDERIVTAVNVALKAVDHDLAWDFTETLSFQFKLPTTVVPTERFDLTAAWGEVKVTDEAVVLAVSFHTDVPRVRGSKAPQRASSVATP